MMTQPEESNFKEFEALQRAYPFAPVATSYGMGWKALQALRYRKSDSGELSGAGAPRRHVLVLTIRAVGKDAPAV